MPALLALLAAHWRAAIVALLFVALVGVGAYAAHLEARTKSLTAWLAAATARASQAEADLERLRGEHDVAVRQMEAQARADVQRAYGMCDAIRELRDEQEGMDSADALRGAFGLLGIGSGASR